MKRQKRLRGDRNGQRTSAEKALKFAGAFFTVAAASAANVLGASPFGGAAYIACVALGFPIWLVLPAYAGVTVGLDFGVGSITAVAATALGGILLRVLRAEKFWAAEVVYLLFSLGGIYGVILGAYWAKWAAGLLLGALALPAFLCAGGKSQMAEGAKFACVAVLGCGLHRIPVLGSAVFGIALLRLVRSGDRRAGAYAAIYGAGGALATSDPLFIALYAVTAAAGILCEKNKWLSGAAACLAAAAFCIVLDTRIIPALGLIAGVFAGVFLPVPKFSARVDKQITFPVVRKMQIAAEACRGVKFALDGDDVDTACLAAAFGGALCDGCKNYAQCRVDAELVEDTVRRAVSARRAGLGVLPDAFIERCARAGDAPKILGNLLKDYECNLAINEMRAAAAGLAAEQLDAFSQLLTDFTEESDTELVADAEAERGVRAHLEERGASFDTMCYSNRGTEAHIVCAGGSEDTVVAAMKHATGQDYAVDHIMQLDGGCEYVLRPAPKYRVVFGVKQIAKHGVCGDTYAVKRLNAGTILAVLCDGMGSGKSAHALSERTVAVMEACFTAGFRAENVLKLVNSLLALTSDRFSCVDICVIDLEAGEASFVKMGGVESLLVRGGETLRIEGGALPLGVAKLPTPRTCKVRLESGDLIVMATDGVTDRGMFTSNELSNPQAAAEEIVSRALGGEEPADDMTALVLRAV